MNANKIKIKSKILKRRGSRGSRGFFWGCNDDYTFRRAWKRIFGPAINPQKTSASFASSAFSGFDPGFAFKIEAYGHDDHIAGARELPRRHGDAALGEGALVSYRHGHRDRRVVGHLHG